MNRLHFSVFLVLSFGATTPVTAQVVPADPAPFEIFINEISELATPTLKLVTAQEKLYRDAGLVQQDKVDWVGIAFDSKERYFKLLDYNHDVSLKKLNPFLGDLRGDASRTKPPSKAVSKSLKYLGLGAEFLKLGDARRKDRDLVAKGQARLANSYVLEQTGQIGIKTIGLFSLEKGVVFGRPIRTIMKWSFPKMSAARLSSILRFQGQRPRAFFVGALDRLDPLADLSEAGARLVGGRRIDAKVTQKAFEGGWGLVQLEMLRKGKLTARYALVAPVFNLGMTVQKHRARKFSTLDVVEDFATQSLDLLVTGVGIRYCQGNYTCAAAVQSVGRATAGTVKAGSSATGRYIMPRIFGQRKAALKQYEDYLSFARNTSTRAKSITQLLGENNLRNMGISSRTIRRLNKTTGAYNRTVRPIAITAPSVASQPAQARIMPIQPLRIAPLRPLVSLPIQRAGSVRGGIRLTQQTGTAVDVNLGAITNAVLGR